MFPTYDTSTSGIRQLLKYKHSVDVRASGCLYLWSFIGFAVFGGVPH